MAKSTSKNRQAEYANYKTQGRQAANRKRKLLKLFKQHPNNLQLEAALKNISYRRGTPKVPHWSHSAKHYAQLFKKFKKPSSVVIEKVAEKQMFSIKERVKNWTM